MVKKPQETPAKITNHSRSSNSNAPAITFSEHIRELRRRVMWVAAVFVLASSLAYYFQDPLMHAILAPLGHQKLIYLSPGGGFGFIFQVTMLAGAVVTAPVLIYQIYRFVTPALPKYAKRHTFKILISSILLLIAGIAFGYFVAVPAALNFLTNFADAYVKASLTTDAYLNFVISYLIGLGILFQLPLLLIFWHWINPFTPKGLLKGERFVILFAFVAAAIITPTPDVFNQSMVAVPIIAIYQLGVITVLIMIRRKNKRQAKEVVPIQLEPETVPVTTDQMPPLEPTPEAPAPAPITPRSRPMGRSIEGFIGRAAPAQPIQTKATQATARPSVLTTNVTATRGKIQPPARPLSVDGLSYVRPRT